MTPEERELLKRSIALAEENNDILRAIRRSMRLARLMTLLYWVIIAAIAVGSYYYLQPYIKEATDTYNSAKVQIEQANGGFNSFWESIKNFKE